MTKSAKPRRRGKAKREAVVAQKKPPPVTKNAPNGRANNSEFVSRCWRVSELMAKGNDAMRAARILSTEASISYRQAYRYVIAVREKWKLEEEKARPTHRAHVVQFLWVAASESMASGDYKASIAAAREIAAITGLHVETVLTNAGQSTVAQAIEDVLGMTPLERERAERELEQELGLGSADGAVPG